MIWLFNQTLNRTYDLVMWPCRVVTPWPGLVLTSFLTAALLVLIFKATSDQAAIRQSRNRFLARTLELLMFQHDLRVSLTACGRILAANAVYLYQFLFPMIVGFVPLLLIFVQSEAWFDRRPLNIGEPTVLTVELDRAFAAGSTAVELQLSETFRVDSPVVRIPSTNELAW